MTTSLTTLATDQLERARAASAGRSAATVLGGHDNALRQTVIALTAGSVLAEHENPGEATLVVLTGQVRLVSSDGSDEGGAGDLLVVPDARHTLEAVEDAAVLLTAVPRGHRAGST